MPTTLTVQEPNYAGVEVKKREIVAEILLLSCSFPLFSPALFSGGGGGGAALFAPRVLMEVAGEVRLSMVITERWAGCYGVPQLHSDSSESPLSCCRRRRRELWRAHTCKTQACTGCRFWPVQCRQHRFWKFCKVTYPDASLLG